MNTHALPKTNTDSHQQETIHFLGNLLTIRAGSDSTDGQFSLIDCLTAPGAGSPPHRQRDGEAFLVTSGQFAFMLNGKNRICGPGETLYVRPGDVHAFVNPGKSPASMLIINFPAGLHEGFFRAVGESVAAGTTRFPPASPPDVEKLTAFAADFGIEILRPQGA